MDWGAWAIIGTSAVGLGVTFVATAIKMTWWLGDRFDKITTSTASSLSAHERKDQERHEENIGRFARLETAILKNGHNKRRR